MAELDDVAKAAREVAKLEAKLEQARAKLRKASTAAVAAGNSKVKVAKAAGVTPLTVHNWTKLPE